MDALMTGLQNLLDPQVLVALLIGSLGGLMIGAVPGIGPAIAIAILTVSLLDISFYGDWNLGFIHRGK